MRHRSIGPFLVAAICCLAISIQAQDRPPISPGVGSAVFLATNSIELDRGVGITSGDLVVNGAPSGPVYGSASLALGRNAATAAGYKLIATSVALDRDATAGGDVYYNTLHNDGNINGSLFTPLAIPVFATLPGTAVRTPGTENIVVPPFGEIELEEGAYGSLTVGRAATVHFLGGGYAFTSIIVDRGSALRFALPSDLVLNGRLSLDRETVVAPEAGSGFNASAIRIQVDGINGSNGALRSKPSAVDVGLGARVFATLQAMNGSIVFDREVEGIGAFIARDIFAGRDGHYAISSGFNQPPVANAQTVTTTGTDPLVITLSGSDPEGGALAFSIVSGPAAGSLTAPSVTSPSTATVTYTPAAAGVADSFTFRVSDTGGATGDAVVLINLRPDDPPDPAPGTVVAIDGSAQLSQDTMAVLLLRGNAPAGVALTFSIVSGTGPTHGSLGPLTAGTEVPSRSATVDYTPDTGYVGSDAFQFQACGVIASVVVCDTASFSITVQEAKADPPEENLASDIEVSTFAESQVLISLGGNSTQGQSRRFVLKPHAAVNIPAAIAGNVADATGNGLGDNANALPGAVPIFMSAGVDQSGGPGSNGTVRMEFEWDLTGFGNLSSSLLSANITLPTHRGTTDSLDTRFFWITGENDGSLTNSDFEGDGERIGGAVMAVPPTMGIGADGTFTFDVLDEVRTAMQLGRSFFTVQGRVDEGLSGPARGLEVRTTASGNLFDVPSLALTTPGVTPPLIYRILSLPASGILRDSGNNVISSVPYTLPDSQVRYTPNTGFLGNDAFNFEINNTIVFDSAVARIRVRAKNCQTDPAGCDDGR